MGHETDIGDLEAAFETVCYRIRTRRAEVPADRSVLVAISGIDGSGKGYVTARLAEALQGDGLVVATLNLDAWLDLPSRRFDQTRSGEHFYRRSIRFGEMFDQLVLPLKANRSISVEVDFAEETAETFRRHTYEFQDVDVILLEGIFLLKREFRRHHDLSVWVECSFETALVRALRRGQEGLPFDQTIRAYQTIYFPAQFIHFAIDGPRSAADHILENDSSSIHIRPHVVL